MAYRITDSASGLGRTTDLVPSSSDYTCIVTITCLAVISGATRRTAFVLKADASHWITIRTPLFVNAFGLRMTDGVTEPSTVNVAYTVGQPLALGYIRKGTTHFFYRRSRNGDGLVEVGRIVGFDVSGMTFTDIQIGTDEAADTETNLDVSYFREWDRALTNNELLIELDGSLSGGAANLETDTPLLANLTDLSGNGHTWTDLGPAGSFVNDIPVAPIVITAETFPFTRTVTTAEFNVDNDIWFKYTASVPTWIGLAVPDDANSYRSSIFLSDGLSELIFTSGTAFGLPVTVGDYYFKIRLEDSGPIGASFDTRFEVLGVVDTLPGCTFIINNDLPGYGAYTFNATTGVPTGVILQPPTGEAAAALPNGVTLWHDLYLNYHAESLVVLDANLNLIASVDTVPPIGTGVTNEKAACVAANASNFYVLRVADNKVWLVTAAGVITDTGNTIVPNAGLVRSIGVSQDGTRLYWTEGTAPPYIVYKWDLTTNTEDTNLYASDITNGYIGITAINAQNGEILVLPDSSTLVNGRNTTDTFTTIYWISADGLLLDQWFTTGEFYLVNHMAYSGSGTTVYLWLYNAAQTLGKIVILDLAGDTFTEVLNSPMFNGAVNSEAGSMQSIGVAVSCSSIVYRYETCPLGPSTGTLVVTKTVLPSSDPTPFPFTAGGGVTPASFSLSHGESQTFTELTPGSGYSVVETVPEGWTVAYAVSNDSPITALVVTAGATTTVTVSNVIEGVVGFETQLPIRWVLRTPVIT